MPKKNNKKLQKIILSPGRALLVLIEKYKNELKRLSGKSEKTASINEEIKKLEGALEKLYLLYLSGTKNEIDSLTFRKVVTNKSLTNYTLSYDYKIIDNDPTRRYFETHLAAITLKNSLEKLDIEDLTSHHKFLYDLLSETKKKEVTEIFYNPTLPLNALNIEYVSVLKSLNDTPSYKEASELDQEKMCLLIKCSILSVFLMTNKPSTVSFPIDIYNIGFFQKENRGVKTLSSQENVHSNHLGIVKSYMPLPISDMAYKENTPFPYLRSADNTTFYSSAKWVRKNFSLLTHPFSSSISGTILCHLRVAKYLLDQSLLPFKNSEHFANFIRCDISVLLYQTGGHSLNEYVSVLKLPEVINAFDQLENFNNIDEKTLFFTENKAAFYQAIDETIVYHNTLLKKEKVHNELKNYFSKEELDYQVINEALIKKIIHKYNPYISNCISNYINEKFNEIELIAQKNHLSYKDAFYLKNLFLKRIEKINFLDLPVRNPSKCEQIIDLEISQEEFVNYIHSKKIAPELSDMKIYCRDNIFSPKLRFDYLAKIKEIKSQFISSCQAIDDTHLINKVNADVQLQYDYVKETMKPDMDCVRMKLYILQAEINKNIKKHYNSLSMSQGEKQGNHCENDARPNRPR